MGTENSTLDSENAVGAINPITSLNQCFNISNYMYYGQHPNINYNTTGLQGEIEVKQLTHKNGKPVECVNDAQGLSEQAFITTGSGPKKIIIGYEGTDLYDTNNTNSNEFTAGQIVDDAQILAGQTPQCFGSATDFAKSVLAMAADHHVSRSDVLVTGHSLGAADAEYAAAKLGLGGYTFGAPGIIVPQPEATLPHHLKATSPILQNYVDVGDPVGNYASDAPTSYSTLLLNKDINHYGAVDALDNSDPSFYGSNNEDLKDAINDIQSYFAGDGDYYAASGLFHFGESIQYHLLGNYATDLGKDQVVLNPIGSEANPTAGSDANFATALLSSAEAPVAAAQVACYGEGTEIRTAEGMRRVEHLQAGDLVVTASGELRPVKWLGHRTIYCRRHRCLHEVLPVRIAAHAFDDNVPTHDLYVSPGHAICVDVIGEVLVPASALVNGSTITQIEVDSMMYWHVELDSHDIIFAQGVPAESYQDRGNRDFFAEHDIVALAASPDTGAPAESCRPICSDGPFVEAARARLQARATIVEARRFTKTSTRQQRTQRQVAGGL